MNDCFIILRYITNKLHSSALSVYFTWFNCIYVPTYIILFLSHFQLMSTGSTDSLYERIVKRLRKGEWVVLKKSDGTFSVCYGMNKNKIQRTEFEADSVKEAIKRATEQRHVRLSAQGYLDDAYDDGIIWIIESIQPTNSKQEFPVDDYLNDEDDCDCCCETDADCADDYDESDEDYPITKFPESRGVKQTAPSHHPQHSLSRTKPSRLKTLHFH